MGIKVNLNNMNKITNVGREINSVAVLVEDIYNNKTYIALVEEQSEYLTIVLDEKEVTNREWRALKLGENDIEDEYKIVAELDIRIEIESVLRRI